MVLLHKFDSVNELPVVLGLISKKPLNLKFAAPTPPPLLNLLHSPSHHRFDDFFLLFGV